MKIQSPVITKKSASSYQDEALSFPHPILPQIGKTVQLYVNLCCHSQDFLILLQNRTNHFL